MRRRDQGRSILVALLLLSCLLLIAGLLAGPGKGAVGASASLEMGKKELGRGRFQEAIVHLKEAVGGEPASCEAQMCLGKAYLKLRDYEDAKVHLRTAIRVGRGSVNAQEANSLLMTMPAEVVCPRTGPQTRILSRIFGFFFRGRGAAVGDGTRPCVIDFYASWCQPCRELEPLIEKVKGRYGDRVQFVRINVDDPDNNEVVDQYGVSPIPTVIFLNSDGEVITYSIGFGGEKVIVTGIEKILSAG